MILLDPKSLRKISYGVYVVTSGKDDRCNGQIANSVIQISSKPAMIAISINKQNYTHELIKETGVFAVSVLSEKTPLSFIGNFGFKCGRDFDKFGDVKYQIGETGTRIVLNYSVAYIEAKVVNQIDAKTHSLFIGEIVDAKTLSDEPQMTYAFYHLVKRGTTPKSAPSYNKEMKEPIQNTEKYICSVCGYVYDPVLGDPDSGVKPMTSFEALPNDWVCPVCGATKNQFEKEKVN